MFSVNRCRPSLTYAIIPHKKGRKKVQQWGKFVIYRKNTGYDFHLKGRQRGDDRDIGDLYERTHAWTESRVVIRCAEAAEIGRPDRQRLSGTEESKFEIYQDQKRGYCFRLLEKAGR